MTVWRGLRWREDVGVFEARCEYCNRAKVASWWPLTLEFWAPSKGMSRCRACWAAYERRGKRRRAAIIPALPVADLVRLQADRRAYHREWAARKRQYERELEGRSRYERRPKSA